MEGDPDLQTMLERLDSAQGRSEAGGGVPDTSHFPKIELHRPSLNKPLLFTEDDSIYRLCQ